MSQVSYFQRFSQKENTATNNTLLLLKYFYQESPIQFERAINALADDTSFTIGPQFEQQKRQGNSVPDGLISQDAFEILIETKDGQKLGAGQIKRHLSGHGTKGSSPQKKRLLIGLTTSPTTFADVQKYKKMASKFWATFIAITFSDIVFNLRESISEQDVHLHSILDDYEQYLADDKLLPEGEILYGIPCGISMIENLRHKIYFEPATRWSKSKGKFIGLYSNKCIRHIGEPKTILTGTLTDNKFRNVNTELGSYDKNIENRILKTIDDCDYFPDFAKTEHRYYLFDSFEKTNFEKSSKGGMWGVRRFNIDDIIGSKQLNGTQNTTLKELANLLSKEKFT